VWDTCITGKNFREEKIKIIVLTLYTDKRLILCRLQDCFRLHLQDCIYIEHIMLLYCNIMFYLG